MAKLRLGGMALPNGVLVHGPSAWGCAVRLPDGSLKTARAYKRFRAADAAPFLRGPLKLAESFALLPDVRRALPEARMPFEGRGVLATTAASALAVQALRRSRRLSAGTRETLSGLLSMAPAVLALRSSDLAAYHGAEHVSIGTYEHGPGREKEHERCGGHLVGPLLATQAIGNALAAKAPPHLRGPARLAATFGALGVSVEIFGWMTRNPRHPLARALSRPGHELQHRLSTVEPTAEQLEVAEAALAACLELEDADADR